MPRTRLPQRPRRAGLAAALALAAAAAGANEAPRPQGPEARKAALRGAAVYAEHCASCHDHPTGRTPYRSALQYRTPGAVVRALAQGSMRPMAAGLSRSDVDAVAAFLTGSLPVPEPEPKPNRCAAPGGPLAIGADDWPALGRDIANTRLQPAPGLAASDLPRLELRFAIALAGGAVGPVAVAGGRLFGATGSGDVFALDAKTGCAHWNLATGQLVRSVSVGTLSGGKVAVFFGDNRGFATALDAETGAKLWITGIEDHPLAKVTAAPTFFEDRVYVPMSSIEDPLQHDPSYACCTSRGSVSALDARTGKLLWKQYTIREAPKPLPPAPGGPARSAPAGGSIFTPLTIDAKRRLVYAATSASYDDGSWPDAESIVAYDLATGERRWSRHFKRAEDAAACRKAGGGSDCRNLFDFAASVAIARLADGREVLVAGQKAGLAYGLDPDAGGELLWTTRIARGSDLGGPMYGLAVEGGVAFFPISDAPDSFAQPEAGAGGLVALEVASGRVLWRRAAAAPVCSWGSEHCLNASIAAATAIPGAVFQGTADGHVRAYATRDGSPLWDFDTARAFAAVNGVEAHGGQVNGWPVVAAHGAVYVVSGASTQARPGNALLVFGVAGR